jgi:hypothetical protein
MPISLRSDLAGGAIIAVDGVDALLIDPQSLGVPSGTTGSRPSSPSTGFLRYNTTLNNLEAYVNGAWVPAALPDGEVTTAKIADGAITGAKIAQGYTYVESIIYTSSTTFSKANYPWLRAIGAHVLAGGGAGGGAVATTTGQASVGGGGAAGGYAFRFITDIGSLPTSATVTIGAAGASASGAVGGTGGNSSFLYLSATSLSANGGVGGPAGAVTTGAQVIAGGAASTTFANGTFTLRGDRGGVGLVLSATIGHSGRGASSNGLYGQAGGVEVISTSAAGAAAVANSGAGGSGAMNLASQTARSGGTGGSGRVVLDLYA